MKRLRNILRLLSSPYMIIPYLRWSCTRVLLKRSPVSRFYETIRFGNFLRFSEYLFTRYGIPQRELELLQACLRMMGTSWPPIAVDVGANIGLFSLALAKMGFVKVYAFEPIPETFARLRLNLSLNPKLQDTIHVENRGLGSELGTFDFLVFPDSPAQNQRINKASRGPGTEIVRSEVVTLDGYFSKQLIERVLLKIDVEGFEADVVKGGVKLLREGRISFLYTELIEKALQEAGSSIQDIEQHLNKCGMFAVDSTSVLSGRPCRCSAEEALVSSAETRNVVFAHESFLEK